jgi:hypothetical protein
LSYLGTHKNDGKLIFVTRTGGQGGIRTPVGRSQQIFRLRRISPLAEQFY